jgi:hypothetical protein
MGSDAGAARRQCGHHAAHPSSNMNAAVTISVKREPTSFGQRRSGEDPLHGLRLPACADRGTGE